MRFFKYITLFFCLTLVFSCTKPEDESPQSIVPSSVTDAPFRDFENGAQDILSEEDEEPTPLLINDDGDDESGPSDGRNPK
ncbi:hypothetical protein O3Q51_16385 [Cryomorphaceae bacterium 1068]|nr:hypothetical protein [Cryomorphaceae bacterium 1068]